MWQSLKCLAKGIAVCNNFWPYCQKATDKSNGILLAKLIPVAKFSSQRKYLDIRPLSAFPLNWGSLPPSLPKQLH